MDRNAVRLLVAVCKCLELEGKKGLIKKWALDHPFKDTSKSNMVSI
jgi:hypothetical protein